MVFRFVFEQCVHVFAMFTRADKFALPNRLARILFLEHTRLWHSSQNAVYDSLSKELAPVFERSINVLNNKRSGLRFYSNSVFSTTSCVCNLGSLKNTPVFFLMSTDANFG